jgi:putative toxin-antitoxin system antitoxin component (TIGR02293 family)
MQSGTKMARGKSTGRERSPGRSGPGKAARAYRGHKVVHDVQTPNQGAVRVISGPPSAAPSGSAPAAPAEGPEHVVIFTTDPSSGDIVGRKAQIGRINDEQALYAPGRSGQQYPLYRMQTASLKSLKGYSEQEIYSLVVPKRTLARRNAAKEPLTVEETDKALRLARIAKLAEQVFGDPDKAGRWMRKPKRALRGETPLVYLASESGAQLVENMLYQIDSGTAA